VWLYAIFRFFWEFLRYPVGIVIHEKEIFGLTKIQLILMFGVVIAAAWWFLVPLLSRALDALDERLNRRKTNKLG
jgi:prolipoprotein diacylglyceryltransferase